MTGAHWLLLLTTDRQTFGSPRSQRAQELYAVLEQVAATAPAEPPGLPSSANPVRHSPPCGGQGRVRRTRANDHSPKEASVRPMTRRRR